MNSVLAPSRSAAGEQELVLSSVGWDQYVTISNALSNHRSLRLIYIDGSLMFVTKSYRHEWLAECFGYLVLAVAAGCRIGCRPVGGTTFRRQDMKAGAEGDKAFYFGAHAEALRGLNEIDLDVSPPPDLAIEIEVTNPANAKMPTWGRLAVPEVWRFDAEGGRLTLWSRDSNGTYRAIDRSAFLPIIAPSEIVELVALWDELDTSSWYHHVYEWVRVVLLPRMP